VFKTAFMVILQMRMNGVGKTPRAAKGAKANKK
jgi:hypothetical protein